MAIERRPRPLRKPDEYRFSGGITDADVAVNVLLPLAVAGFGVYWLLKKK